MLAMKRASHENIIPGSTLLSKKTGSVPFFKELGLGSLGVIASGALLLTVSPSDLSPLQKTSRENSIPSQVIGKLKKGPVRVLRIDP